MLAAKKTKILTKDAVIFAKASKKSEKLAKARKHAVVEELKTQNEWGKLQAKTNKDIVRWIKRKIFWNGSQL
jgi:hypothetical protein